MKIQGGAMAPCPPLPTPMPAGSRFLATFESLAKQKIQRAVCDLQDQMGGFGGQRSKETVCIQYII